MADIDRRIKPSDLKAECMRCGGSGRRMVKKVEAFPITKHQHTVMEYAGPCPHCSGSGRTFPRKVDV